MNNPNSFDGEVQDAAANPEESSEGTEQTDTVQTPAVAAIDYETKFKESAREAQRLYEEKKALQAELERRSQPPITTPPTDEFFPGFETLDEDSRRNLLAYTDAVKRKAIEEVYKDPDIAYVKTEAKEKRWNGAFDQVANELPDLKDYAVDFRAKYYNPNANVDATVLKELAKSFLFDKAREIGANEERQRANRVDLEDVTGGDKTPRSVRSLEDWAKMARENPGKFASMSKEYNEDLQRGI
jgi:hypothetical protein